MKYPKLVQVEDNGRPIGPITWEEAHGLCSGHFQNGKLHAVVHNLIFYDLMEQQILLSLRSKNILFPGLWSIASAGNVDWIDEQNRAENIEETAYRELHEELFHKKELPDEIKLIRVRSFIYQAGLRDKEYCTILKGYYKGPFFPYKQEVEDAKFFDVEFLKRDLLVRPSIYTPGLASYLKDYFGELE